ncbi:MAG TPA: periplasmic heavy metal sensor [Thermoanaerobaculia bacterium]
MVKRLLLVLGLVAAICVTMKGEAGPGEDPFSRYLFPPEQVIGHAQEIGLDEAQRSGVREEIKKAQPKFIDLQFAVQEEMGKLNRLLQEKPIDEARILSEVDRVLELERSVKRLHLSLLIRIRNLLTPAQQEKLSEAIKTGK